MIYTPQLREIEVDSTSLDQSGNPVLVDDVIVRYDNFTLYVQAKKNQTNFKGWSVGDLGEELKKAWIQWRRDPSGRLLFISRNDFGDVAKLKEYASTQPTPEAFDHSLTVDLRRIADRVAIYDELTGNRSDLYSFLLQLNFETVNPERFKNDLLGQLHLHVAHGSSALERITARIDAISRRDINQSGLTISPHSLTRQGLHELLRNGGIEVCLPKAEQDAIDSLSQLSQIGRNWQRRIGAVQLSRPVVGEILERTSKKPPCLLLAAGPGVGKTCVLLSVLEHLERDASTLPVFIQAREFAAAKTTEEREALGLPSSLVIDVARLSETRHVVVLIDSIDVLSIARDHHALSFILSLIDRLRLIPNATVIAACRSFDVKYDGRLADRDWGETVEIELLDWDREIVPILAGVGVDPNQVPANTRELLCNPRLLAIFHDIVSTGIVPIARSGQELTEHYLQRVVRGSAVLGDSAMTALMGAARWMLDNRRLDIPLANARMAQKTIHSLLSAGVMVETHQRGLAFAHQTLLDVLAVAHAKIGGETLAAFIRTRAAAPFIRPTVRAFLFSLRTEDVVGFRRQVREVVDADNIAFHLRRLVAESLAEVSPTADDWPLVRHIFTAHSTLFNAFYQKTAGAEWLDFLHSYWLDLLILNQDGPWLTRFLERMASAENFSAEFIDVWRKSFDWDWIDQRQLHWISSHLLDQFSDWEEPGLREVFERLVANTEEDHSGLGKPLSRWVSATDSHDDLLWQYITRQIESADFEDFNFGRKLECDLHAFGREDFLKERLQASEVLLDLVLNDIEVWSDRRRRPYEADRELTEGFLHETQHGRTHSAGDMHHVDGLTMLLSALENACKYHAQRNTSWWHRNIARLRSSRDAALRFFALLAITEDPEAHTSDASAMLLDGTMLNCHRLRWEVGLLLNAAFPHLTSEHQEEIQALATAVDADDRDQDGSASKWQILAQRDLLAHIPINYRTREVQAIIDWAETLDGPFSRYPRIDSRSGWVRPPVSREIMLELSDASLARLINHYSVKASGGRNWDRSGSEGLVGGADEMVREVQEASSRQPTRFMRFYESVGSDLEAKYAEAILAGIATNLRYRFGNLRSSDSWSATEEPDGLRVADWLIRMVESHYDFWVGRRDMATILEATADVFDSDEGCERIAFLLFGCLKSEDPGSEREDTNDRLFVAINSTRGVAAQAAFTLASRWLESSRPLPSLLVQVLKRCASDPHPSVRALVLRSLPIVLHYNQELGWHLFERALFVSNSPPWRHAYNCLYYNYHKRFPIVAGYLSMLRGSNDPEALKAWSRISALCSLAGHIGFEDFIADLRAVNLDKAWAGAASVFAANFGEPRLQSPCTQGLLVSLNSAKDKNAVLGKMFRFLSNCIGHPIDLELLESYLRAVAAKKSEHGRDVLGLGDWLASLSVVDPEYALIAIETMLGSSVGLDAWDGSPYTKLMTALFREAEERELSDQGQFLSRTVAVQDTLLRRGMHSLEDWLKDAERP
jgi:hypothetical protein